MFPYWKKSLATPKEMFNNLQTQVIKTEQDNNNNTIIIRKYPNDYMICDHLSNHFTENIRVNCRVGKNPTPFEIWKKIKTEEKILTMNKYNQREYVYSLSKECNTFNVSYCYYIIKELVGCNANILDPSSGWGDRLIASIANNANIYHGFDPNKTLQKSYKKIIDEFNISGDCNIQPIPFEESILEDNFYDLAITSPPYYDLEIYSNDSTQSVVKYNTYESWLVNFFEVYLQKMANAIKIGGYMAIYIENIVSNNKQYNLRSHTINYLNNNKQLKYHSKIGLKVGERIRWTLIWKK